MNERISQPLRVMDWSLLISVAAIIGAYATARAIPYGREPNSGSTVWLLFFASMVVLLAGSISFAISMGILAKRLGKSWIVYVGLSCIIPFGGFVMYALLRKHATKALREAQLTIA